MSGRSRGEGAERQSPEWPRDARPAPSKVSARTRSPGVHPHPHQASEVSPITLRPCQGLRLPSGPPCCPRRSAKDSTLQAEWRGSLGGLHGAAWGTRVAHPSPSSLRTRSRVEREDGGGEPSSSSMLMKPTWVSKLMTLDQNPPRLADPEDSRLGGLVSIKECGGGLLAGEVWRAGAGGFLVLTPSPRPGRS